jgi:hypothetical protein
MEKYSTIIDTIIGTLLTVLGVIFIILMLFVQISENIMRTAGLFIGFSMTLFGLGIIYRRRNEKGKNLYYIGFILTASSLMFL